MALPVKTRDRATAPAVALALLLSPTFAGSSPAQGGAGPGGAGQGGPALKSPAVHQVFQRDRNDRATIPIVYGGDPKDLRIASAAIIAGNGQPVLANGGPDYGQTIPGVRFEGGALVGVPSGGPYTVHYREIYDGPATAYKTIGPVFVGDLWVLAGQSNMQGVGDLVDITPPDPRVMCLGMDGAWKQAEEPLHWLVDSPDPVHSGDTATREERSSKEHRERKKGAGLGLPFAAALVGATDVPIGLVACAHGGTSMEQWNPNKKNEGGKSLYGSMLRQVQFAGGKVAGVLWYQGESDALSGNPEVPAAYPRVFADFIAATRSDFGQPDLPFYLVQIGRVVRDGDSKGWNAVQEAQRLIPDRVGNTAVVSVIDLELDDGIHVGTEGLKRAGQRLARVALREQFGRVGATTPTFGRVVASADRTLRVKFQGVNFGEATPADFGTAAFSTGMPRPGNPAQAAGGMMSVAPGPPQTFDLVAVLAPTPGLRPERHIAGFSIRKADGTPLPLIYDAAVDRAKDTVVLKLSGRVPADASLWYGHGLDPYCNLVDGLDMAVPVFGPVPLEPTP